MNDVYTATVELPVPPEEAFALVTEPERLRRWAAVCATVDLRAGGAWSWRVTPAHVAAGQVREVEPGRRLVLGWGWEGDVDGTLPPDASTVTVVIEPTGDGSRVTLTHEGLVGAQLASHAEGWKHYLERLERLAVKGDAGPDEWAWAPEPLDPIVAGYAALAVIQPVLRGLTAEDQPRPTPCPDFTCHGLAVHLMDSISALGGMAGATVTMPAEGSLESKVSRMTDQALGAWREHGLGGDGPGRPERAGGVRSGGALHRAPAARLGPCPGQPADDGGLRRGRVVRRGARRSDHPRGTRFRLRRRRHPRGRGGRPGPVRGVLRTAGRQRLKHGPPQVNAG